MTKEHAKQQLEAFFLRIGQKASLFDDKDVVKARIGEAILGFEFHEDRQVLSAEAFVYRFRQVPQNEVLDAIQAAGQVSDTGGGSVVYDANELTVYLQRDFTDQIAGDMFYSKVNQLAAASLRWNSDVLERVAEKVSAKPPAEPH